MSSIPEVRARILRISLHLALTPVAAAADISDGYHFEAAYTGEVLSNVSGGLDTGTRYLDNLDLMLEVDVADAWGVGRGTFFIYGLYNNGSTFEDEVVGDLQVTSNIDAPAAWRIYEAWYELGRGPWSIRTGLYDLNSEFDVNETGGLFLNSSHGIGPDFSQSGENGPSIFPVSSLAIRGAWETERLTPRLAVLDGVPGRPEDPSSNAIKLSSSDGALLVGEVDVPLSSDGRLWAGYWRYTADFERPFGSGTSDDNDGWYLGAEQGFELGALSGSAFVRYGQADEELNELSDYVGAGIVINAPLADRPDDRLGLAVASAGAGDPYREFLDRSGENSTRRETTWELTFRVAINEVLALQPNMQWIRNPAAVNEFDDAWVIGLRIVIAKSL